MILEQQSSKHVSISFTEKHSQRLEVKIVNLERMVFLRTKLERNPTLGLSRTLMIEFQ